MNQLSLDWAIEQGRIGRVRAQVRAEHAQPNFTRNAAAYMYAYLVANGPTSGEALTDAAVAAGHTAPDLRAYGAVHRRLVSIGARVVGSCARRKGHGSAGGKIYGI